MRVFLRGLLGVGIVVIIATLLISIIVLNQKILHVFEILDDHMFDVFLGSNGLSFILVMGFLIRNVKNDPSKIDEKIQDVIKSSRF